MNKSTEFTIKEYTSINTIRSEKENTEKRIQYTNYAIAIAGIAAATTLLHQCILPYIGDLASSPYGYNALNVLKDVKSVKDFFQIAPAYKCLIPETILITLPVGIRSILTDNVKHLNRRLEALGQANISDNNKDKDKDNDKGVTI